MIRLTDEQWERIRKHFPEEHIPDGRAGRKPIPTRHVLEAVLWILNTGAQWHMLPQSYPNYKTVHRRFQTWCCHEILRLVLKLVGNVRQYQTQNLVAAPSLKASMHSFVVRIALRQHVPLRTCVENPQNRFQHMTSRNRLASSTPIGNMLLRKMLPNAVPLFVRQPNQSSVIADR